MILKPNKGLSYISTQVDSILNILELFFIRMRMSSLFLFAVLFGEFNYILKYTVFSPIMSNLGHANVQVHPYI